MTGRILSFLLVILFSLSPILLPGYYKSLQIIHSQDLFKGVGFSKPSSRPIRTESQAKVTLKATKAKKTREWEVDIPETLKDAWFSSRNINCATVGKALT